jgi:hypothetical protein
MRLYAVVRASYIALCFSLLRSIFTERALVSEL